MMLSHLGTNWDSPATFTIIGRVLGFSDNIGLPTSAAADSITFSRFCVFYSQWQTLNYGSFCQELVMIPMPD